MGRLRYSTAFLALIACVAMADGNALHAQDGGTVTGRVVNAANLQPISSAQVFIPSLGTGVLTREDGGYTLVNVPAGNHTIQAQILGFRNATEEVVVAAGQSVTVNFSMQQDALALDEVIVTGTPGGTQRRAIGNVVTRVSAAEVTERQPVEDMQQLLSGRAPGLNFTRASGNIGTGSQIRIRGVSTLSLGTQPLIYVDGVRINNSGTRGPRLISGAQSSSLDDINPDDIASIEIIKGPAAATLYGTEASAGVIQIITKKGQVGSPTFDFSTTQGTNFMMDPAGRLGTQWGCRVTARPCPSDQLFSFNIYEIEEAAGREPFSNGHAQAYNLGIRGGTDAVRYYLSTEYSDNGGIVEYNWERAMNLRANVGVLITDGLNVDVSTGYIAGKTSYLNGDLNGGLWDNMMWAQGSLLDTPLRGYLQNTPEDFATVSSTREYNRFTGSATLTHTATSWLTQRLIAGTDYASDENQVLYPRDPAGAAGPFRNLSLGDVTLERPITTLFTLDYSASARYGLGPAMQWTSSVGAQYYSNRENKIESRGSVFASPAIRSIEGATNKTINQEFIDNKSLGVFAQQELNYNDRLYLTGAIRMDDNSAFGAEFDAAVYPKVSAAWLVSEEDFWAPMSRYVNSLRLRSAWGKAGRQPSTFAAVTLFDPSVGPGGSAVVTPGQYGNPNVGPEVSTELEVGFEAAMFGDRVTADVTYFTQKVRDALVRLPMIPTGGFAGEQEANVGRLDNWGWEARVDARLIEGEDFAFALGATGAHSMNKIIDLGGRPETIDVREGFPYPVYVSNIITSAEFDDFHQPINVMCDGGTGLQNRERGGPEVPCSEMVGRSLLLGTRYPSYTWAMDGTVSLFQDLQLFTMVQAEFGRWGSDTNVYCSHTPCYSNARIALERNDAVYEEGVVFNGRHPTDGTLYIRYDADFVKLREVGARYVLPQNLVRRVGGERASISVTGRNLATLWQRQTEISGVNIADPELASPAGGSALFQVPGLSSITAALRVTF